MCFPVTHLSGTSQAGCFGLDLKFEMSVIGLIIVHLLSSRNVHCVMKRTGHDKLTCLLLSKSSWTSSWAEVCWWLNLLCLEIYSVQVSLVYLTTVKDLTFQHKLLQRTCWCLGFAFFAFSVTLEPKVLTRRPWFQNFSMIKTYLYCTWQLGLFLFLYCYGLNIVQTFLNLDFFLLYHKLFLSFFVIWLWCKTNVLCQQHFVWCTFY